MIDIESVNFSGELLHSKIKTTIVNIECERDESSFINVAATLRSAKPFFITRLMELTSLTTT